MYDGHIGRKNFLGRRKVITVVSKSHNFRKWMKISNKGRWSYLHQERDELVVGGQVQLFA